MSLIPAIILAAGLSSRMRTFKPVLRLGGETLIGRLIAALQSSGVIEQIVVVTGHQRGQIELAIAGLHVSTVFNADYATGEMLSSLRVGIQNLPRSAPGLAQARSAFLLALADQPAVQPATIRAVVGGFFGNQNAPLALPMLAGKRGHPVVLSTALIPAILSLAPDDSLRTVVHQHLADAAMVPVNDPWVLEDLDTPEDFARAEAKFIR